MPSDFCATIACIWWSILMTLRRWFATQSLIFRALLFCCSFQRIASLSRSNHEEALQLQQLLLRTHSRNIRLARNLTRWSVQLHRTYLKTCNFNAFNTKASTPKSAKCFLGCKGKYGDDTICGTGKHSVGIVSVNKSWWIIKVCFFVSFQIGSFWYVSHMCSIGTLKHCTNFRRKNIDSDDRFHLAKYLADN